MKREAHSIVEIASVAEYLDSIQQIVEKNQGQDLFFRGQTQLGETKGKDFIEWKLEPSIFRDNRLSNEKEYYSFVMTECAGEFSSCLNHCEILSKMQHYGVPTRLMDVTSNALVALFFSCVNEEGITPRQDGAVYVIAADRGHIKEFDSDTITILSSLPRFSREVQAVIKECAVQALKIPEPINAFNQNDNKEVQRLLHEIKKEKPAFEPKIQPEHLLDNFVFTPQKTHPRIIRQNGAFILFGLEDTSIPEREGSQTITSPVIIDRVVVKQASKKGITKTLDQCGISLATMYPELYKVAAYLKNSKLKI